MFKTDYDMVLTHQDYQGVLSSLNTRLQSLQAEKKELQEKHSLIQKQVKEALLVREDLNQ